MDDVREAAEKWCQGDCPSPCDEHCREKRDNFIAGAEWQAKRDAEQPAPAVTQPSGTTAQELLKQLGPGRVFVIHNDQDEPIGALTAEQGTGVERILDALSAWRCPNTNPHKCLPISVCKDSVVVVFSKEKAALSAKGGEAAT